MITIATIIDYLISAKQHDWQALHALSQLYALSLSALFIFYN